jgi:hypothetical protein
MTTGTTIFEIAKETEYNFTPTNKNIFIKNLTPEQLIIVNNYLEENGIDISNILFQIIIQLKKVGVLLIEKMIGIQDKFQIRDILKNQMQIKVLLRYH